VRLLLLLGLTLLLVPAASAMLPPPAPFPQTEAFLVHYRAHDGVLRPAVLLLPAGYRGGRIPLVISPHGSGVGEEANGLIWGDLPGEGDFAVINPAGEGRRLHRYSWGAPGEIADLARMPRIVERYGVHVDPTRIYAFGGSMGGQESLLLLARDPHLLAGVAAFDPATNMALRFRDFAALPNGRALRRLAITEIGGTPAQVPDAYAVRSPSHDAAEIARSGVPLQLYWSTHDWIIRDQRRETQALAVAIRDDGDRGRLWDFRGAWEHTAEMQPTRCLPRALARFGLLPWQDVPHRERLSYA
jgi:pimeloyl-ACP methyl ester carboxylesterase